MVAKKLAGKATTKLTDSVVAPTVTATATATATATLDTMMLVGATETIVVILPKKMTPTHLKVIHPLMMLWMMTMDP